jgi:hypothetical protein
MTAFDKLAALCPHGDSSCPCQDGDPCHYEGNKPFECGIFDIGYHCHVEGCAWRGYHGQCGLAKLVRTWTLCSFAELRGTPEWYCGAARHLTSSPNQLKVLTEGPMFRD